jgi:sortase A
MLAAFVLAAYIAWLLWGTGLYTAREQDALRQDFQQLEQAEEGPVRTPGKIPKGDAWSILRIPAIDLNAVVVQGTAIEDLKRGPGHYLGTANPWQRRGTTAIAGHRTTYGAWFWNLDKLKKGDPIVLETHRGTFHYDVTRLAIVGPGDVKVLRPTAHPTLVLTTCNPRFSAAQRLIAFARQVERQPDRGDEPSGGPAGVQEPQPAQSLGERIYAVGGIGGGALALALVLALVNGRWRERRREGQLEAGRR